MKFRELAVLFFLKLLIISGCGIVQRTAYPDRFVRMSYDCSRNINIFAPKDYKIYYSMNNSDWVYDGVSNGDKHTILVHEKYSASKNISNWSLWNSNDVENMGIQLGYDVRRKGYTMMSIKILKPDGTVCYNDSFNLWGWYDNGSMSYNSVSDFPEVKSHDSKMLKDEVNSSDVLLIYEYYDKSIEVQY